jgi:4-amino-4-deoxy-L-arabinose transferase-like glycosyltransferase
MKRVHSSHIIPFITIFTFALIVRVCYNLVAAHKYYPLHDSLTYQSIALQILHNHCYCLLPQLPTLDRAPLWPVIIAAIYGTLGQHDRTVRLFLSLVGSITCVLIYCFARDMFGKRPALLTGLLAGAYPFLYVYDGWLYSESLYTCLLLAFCYTIYHLRRAPHTLLMVLSGLQLGLLSLTRPNGLILLAIFLLWALIIKHTKSFSWPQTIKIACIVTLVSLALVIPWTIRNYTVTHQFVPIAVGDGKVLLGAYNDMILQRPYYLGIWIIPSESSPSIAQQFPSNCAGPCELQRDNTYRYYAEQWMHRHPNKLPYLLSLHLANFWQTTTQEADLAINRFPGRPTSHLIILMMEIITPLVLALAAFGLLVTRKLWRDLLFIYMMILLTLTQCLILYSIPRFRAPIEPLLLLLASGSIHWIIPQLRHWQQSRQAAHTTIESTEKTTVPFR